MWATPTSITVDAGPQIVYKTFTEPLGLEQERTMQARSIADWTAIFPKLPAPADVSVEQAIANRIIADLVGYQHKSKHRVSDIDSIANALIVYAKMLHDNGVRPLGAIENVGSTTRDKPAPFLPPLFDESLATKS